MEHNNNKIPQNPSVLPSQPSANLKDYFYGNSSATENHTQNPSFTNTSDQEIESAFSRLNISQNYQPRSPTPQPPCFAIPYTNDPAPQYFAENQKGSSRAEASTSNGGVNGLFRPHKNINVGPRETDGFYRGDDYVDSSQNLMGYEEQDFSNANWNYAYGFHSLHGKKTPNCDFPILPSLQRSRAYGFSQQFQQELTVQKMGELNLKLDEGLSEREIEVVLSEMMEFLGDMMKNQYFSDIFVKLFETCNGIQRNRIVEAIVKFPSKLINICLSLHGSQAMQKILGELIFPPQIWLLVSTLSLGAVSLATDPNGHKVLEYCIKNFPEECTKSIVDKIAENCFKVGTNKSGCCVIQCCVGFHNGKARDYLIIQILANALHFSEDPYGNYVVQHLIVMRIPEVTAELLRRFRGCFVLFSCNKYASNVVEKFLLTSGHNISAQIIMEILASPEASMLLLDPYGNFVIQKALTASKINNRVFGALENLIEVNARFMQSNLYGRKILTCLEKERRSFTIHRR